MKTNIRFISLIAISSILSAILGVFIYAVVLNPVDRIYVEAAQQAQAVSEREFIFSEKMKKLYTSSAPTDFIDAAKASRTAVVFIRALNRKSGTGFIDENFNSSSGSGVIISPDGYIATNNHVIEDADQVEVMLNDNREYKAKVIGTDPETDLALLKIESYDLEYMIFGDSDSVQIGEWVMAVGNPFRLQSTVTAGIVSAKARNINIMQKRGIESFIQTDAAVNPGNSGGALINTRGELVGINTAIMTLSGRYEGFSFAIPANLAKKVITDLREYGAVQRGWLGITIIDVDNALADRLGLPQVSGVYIDLVNKGEAAQQAGLQKGDVILEVDKIKTNTMPQFMEQIGQHRPGDVIAVKYFRNGEQQIANVTLKNQLNTTDYIAVRKDKLLTNLGFELRDLDSFEKSKLKSEGVYVVSVYNRSTIGQTNLEPGYIITSVNNIKVESVNQLIAFLKENKGTVVLEGFYENYPGEYPYTFNNE